MLPFHQKKFAVINTGSEVFKGRIEDKFTPILEQKLAVYGCEMAFHKVCDDDPAGITAAILEAKAAGCELIFTTGGMSVDPDDRTPLAIRNTGAEIVTYGAPVLPGAMFLVSYLDGVPVCGLPGCVMYAKRTIFDLLLPRLLADDPITAEDIARLGEAASAWLRRVPLAQLRLRTLLKPSQPKPFGFASSPRRGSLTKVKKYE